ncbi:MAG TPA: glycoside hydrolase family 31 protein, partial [Clostridiales bacterium]|nr:glycoside hydrolase family 31 protein [Clostridiales bacterium]
IPDADRYPDLADHVEMYHDRGIRVMLWATCMVNEGSPTFEEGLEKGYFVAGGKTLKWWSGKGAFVDYTNPEAVEWFHRQMDIVLDMGIDGWKVDGADPYIMLLLPAYGKNDLHITWKEYRDLFYRDFFEYTREKLGNDRVISARPVNDIVLRVGSPLVFTSRDINFAGWVGDNDNDWGGLRHALNDMLASSRYNFVSYGSDIGGFRNPNKEKYKDVFIRWTQLGAFCPVMENGGNGEHAPWKYDEETLNNYRKFTHLHHELIPYIYSQAAYSYELVKPTMRPTFGTYQYLLGEDILVAPVFEPGNTRTVVFPPGEWVYMFDQNQVYKAGIRKLEFEYDEFPVFIRKGAIIPLNVTNGLNQNGSELSAPYTTVQIYPKNGEKKFGLYEEGKRGTMLSYKKTENSLEISAGPSDRNFLFCVKDSPAPSFVTDQNGLPLPRLSSFEELANSGRGYFVDGGNVWYANQNGISGINIQIGC